jgi:hypothetical protein
MNTIIQWLRGIDYPPKMREGRESGRRREEKGRGRKERGGGKRRERERMREKRKEWECERVSVRTSYLILPGIPPS